MSDELKIEELASVTGGDASVSTTTLGRTEKGYLNVSTTKVYTAKGNYTTTTCTWTPD